MFPHCILPEQTKANDYQNRSYAKRYDRNGFIVKAMQTSESQYKRCDTHQYVRSNVHSYFSHKEVVFLVISTFLLGIAAGAIFLGICSALH
jgi:hypothetical protein